MTDRLLTTNEVGKLFGLNPKSLANARSSGMGIKIPFIKLGTDGVVRYKESDILAYIESNTFEHTGEVKDESQ
tara:strand:- start:317 stop:535 length:219 start_codon:yes stop_codon:yes gene_type:complete